MLVQHQTRYLVELSRINWPDNLCKHNLTVTISTKIIEVKEDKYIKYIQLA
jgi:hypothetical protein